MVSSWLLLASVVAISAVGVVSSEGTPPPADDKAAVAEANKNFYQALNTMFTGKIEPMLALWSHAEDVTYMGPTGGFKKGWKLVEADWKAQAAMKLGGKVTPKDVHVTVGKDLAVVSDVEVGQNVDKDGKPLKVEIRATNIYRKEGGKWKMIGHHTDLLPYLDKG